MTPAWKAQLTKPRIRDVRLVFGGRVAFIKLSGSQDRIEATAVYQEIADKLVAGGISDFLLDIRDAVYPPRQVSEIVARTEWLGRTYPHGRAALWHAGEAAYTVSLLVGALQRSGHEAIAVRSALEARRVLAPHEEKDVWMIDDDPRLKARR